MNNIEWSVKDLKVFLADDLHVFVNVLVSDLFFVLAKPVADLFVGICNGLQACLCQFSVVFGCEAYS